MRNYILLFVNGGQHRISDADIFLTLSDYLRLRLKLCGTKIVCSEGDCGSCSVLCGKLTDTEKPINYLAIDSCIRFVFQLDGCHVVTVEGLNGEGEAKAELNGVQRAMIDCHGSQCGFCTPGFVVAMTGVLEQNSAPSIEDWRHALTGNLCRCTGYSPIVAAGERSNRENTPQLNLIYSSDGMFDAFSPIQNDSIKIETGVASERNVVFCPTTISDAVEFLAENPRCQNRCWLNRRGSAIQQGTCPCKSLARLEQNRRNGIP